MENLDFQDLMKKQVICQCASTIFSHDKFSMSEAIQIAKDLVNTIYD